MPITNAFVAFHHDLCPSFKPLAGHGRLHSLIAFDLHRHHFGCTFDGEEDDVLTELDSLPHKKAILFALGVCALRYMMGRALGG